MDNHIITKPILFFDGHCVLCNFLAEWFLGRASERFFIASLQGETARELGLEKKEPDSVVLWKSGKAYFKSEAVILALIESHPNLRFLQLLLFLPDRWLNGVYDLVARSRYRVFGRKEVCRIPTPEEESYFLP